ncbi:hypothetical protein ACFFSW_26090 [Saccharothrix longispora]|uniref:Uncharacterized protein n=1 Tax=Saccharothrix longispora TaxID=33920 RepID=A0ABU1PPG0_9PSEU|nr:hypothetical protein [Saccharothrix longispora]MDR6592466.1 hypothetical protein [Saccharothrix longispora]
MHKTRLIEDGVPEVVQHKRLGHRYRGVRGIYSHVTHVMIDGMLGGLQTRWERSVAGVGAGTAATYGGGAVTTYGEDDQAKIVCSQFAPTDAERPVGEDHQPAV